MDEENQFQEFVTQDSLNLGSPKPVKYAKDSLSITEKMRGDVTLDDEFFMLGSFDNPLSIDEEEETHDK